MEAHIEKNMLIIAGTSPPLKRGFRVFFHPYLRVLLLKSSDFGISLWTSDNTVKIPLSHDMMQELPKNFKNVHFSGTMFSANSNEYYLLVPDSQYSPTPKQVIERIEEFWEIIPSLESDFFVNKPEILLKAGELKHGVPHRQKAGLLVVPRTSDLKLWLLDLAKYQVMYEHKQDIVAIVPYDALTIDGLVPARGGLSSYFFSLSKVDWIRIKRYRLPPLTNRLISTYALEQNVLYLKLGILGQR